MILLAMLLFIFPVSSEGAWTSVLSGETHETAQTEGRNECARVEYTTRMSASTRDAAVRRNGKTRLQDDFPHGRTPQPGGFQSKNPVQSSNTIPMKESPFFSASVLRI